jgi:hypothetical protein
VIGFFFVFERCISSIKKWSTDNDLKLNDEKTEVLHISSRFRKPSSLCSVNVCETPIEPVNNARNLGVIVDHNLQMDMFIKNICRSATYALYRIGQIRRFLDRNSTEMLVHAFISCRLDQCNSLFYGLPESQLNKLQRIQNSAARLVTLSRKHDHITPILQELHWLPIRYRIMYKILLLTYKCIHGIAPISLRELIKEYIPARNSSIILATATFTCSSTSTIIMVSVLFLQLQLIFGMVYPLQVKNSNTCAQFKTTLKTHLFTIAF